MLAPEAVVWSDNETAIDSLNVQHLVKTILQLLQLQHLSPVTIGVYGDWGSGKSSVVLMLKEQLMQGERAKDTLCIIFNGWRFEGYEDAKSALMTTILEEIQACKTLPEKAKEAAKNLLTRVDVLRLGKGLGKLALHAGLAYATGGTSLVASAVTASVAQAKATDTDTIAEEIDGIIKDPESTQKKVHQSVRDFENDFRSVLEQTKLARLVVVIDDLDRCGPDRVIETLEAIRLFLAVPKTAFILAADEDMVQHAVKLRFPAMEALKETVGRDYLEKMVQIPIRVPPLGPTDLESYMNMLFFQLHMTTPGEFEAACKKLLAKAEATAKERENTKDSSVGKEFRVTAVNAHEFIGEPLTEDMKKDLALASQVRRVVEMSVDGNPRQVKRYLNAFRLRLLMAAARGITLDPRVAAKLMLLEYFRLETLRTIARWQATYDGKPIELGLIEANRAAAAPESPPILIPATARSGVPASRARPAKPTRTQESAATHDNGPVETAAPRAGTAESAPAAMPALPPEARLWAADEWMQAWLDTEPLLGNVDLRPYFYFARDRLGIRSQATQRLSSAARELLPDLLSPAQAVRDRGAVRARQLIAPDVVALQEALAERVRASENLDEADLPFHGMLALVATRPELVTEFAMIVRSLPLNRFRAGTPNRLLAAAQSMEPTAKGQVVQLVQMFADQSEHPTLAAAASIALRPPTPR